MKRFLIALLLAAVAQTQAAAVETDRFYLDLFRDAMQSYDRGDFGAATKLFRLACFGMLDDPPQLAGCLTRLALAQSGASDSDGFRETFHRLVEVQDRFGAYEKATLPAEIRSSFEQRSIALVPRQTLESSSYFAALTLKKLENELAALPPRERRHQLEDRVAKEPKNPIWHVMLGEIELAEGRGAAAVSQAQQAVALDPNQPEALCIRGLARASLRSCSEAIPDLTQCPRSSQEPAYAAGLLGCRVELQKWSDAEQQVHQLVPALRQDRKLIALVQQVSQHSGESKSAPTKQPERSAAPKAQGAIQPTAKAPGSISSGPPGALRVASPAGAPRSKEELGDFQHSQALLNGTTEKDLREALRLASGLATRHPEWTEVQYLAAEASYRNSRWADAVAFFKRAGEPGEEQPDLLFYLAISLFETGDRANAQTVLKRALPRLQRSAYVDSYAQKILGNTHPD